MNFTIRQEKAADYPQVFELNSKAFGREDEAKLVENLRKNPEVFVPELSLVAEAIEKIIGHILMTKILIKNNVKTFESLALAPVAVLPDFQKSGIGKQLVQQVLAKAKSLGFSSVVVLGHPDYYPKFGFLRAEKFAIKPPFPAPIEAFMALELQDGALENSSGTVIYPKEFQDL